MDHGAQHLAQRDGLRNAAFRVHGLQLLAAHAGIDTAVQEQPLATGPGQPPTPRLAALAQLLQRGGIEAKVSDNIQRDAWYKLWGNMTVNPVSACARRSPWPPASRA